MSKDLDLFGDMTRAHIEERERLLAEAKAKYDRDVAPALKVLREKQGTADKIYRERLSGARHAGQIKEIDNEHTEAHEAARREWLAATQSAQSELSKAHEQSAIGVNRTIARVTQE